MRTTQKQLSHLLRSIRLAIGARTNADVWKYIAKEKEQLEGELQQYDVSAVSITPYADNSWILTGYDSVGCSHGQVRNVRVYLPDNWINGIEDSISQFKAKLKPKS